MCEVKINKMLKGIELYFETKPTQEVREEMKANGFRWNGKKLCWYAKQSEKTLSLGEKLSGLVVVDNIETETVKAAKSNKINLYELTTFKPFEVEKSYNTKEIAKQIRTHLKARFKFIKMSVTCPYSGKISISIKESPFVADSAYMEAIKSYIEKYVDNFKVCTSYDPYGDYGSSYNFYFFGADTWDMVETEPTQEIIEAMKEYDEKLKELEEARKIQEEREYQEYLAKREQERKEAEERKKKIKEDKEYIKNNVEVVEIEKDSQYYVKDVNFANMNKNNTLEQYQEEVAKGDFYNNTLKVTREIHFKDEKSYNLYINMLLHDFDFIDGTGGSYTEDLRINSMVDYYNMSEEEQKTVEWLLSGIAIYLNNKLMFVVDAQGYCYARYVGLIGENTVVTKEFKYNQVVDVEEIEQRKIEAEEIKEVYNNVIEKNSSNSWYDTRKAIANAIKKNPLLIFDKETIQQIKDEKIKNDLYRVLNEVDTIQNQFDDADIKQGEKLTLVRGSMIGGANISHIEIEGFMAKEYAQYNDNIKMTMKVKGKRGLYSTNLHGDDILIYKGWIDIPSSVLYEDTSNSLFNGMATKYGSYDKKALDDIIEYLQEQNVLPIVSTCKPVF